jgi:trimethylamine corrinoid protein
LVSSQEKIFDQLASSVVELDDVKAVEAARRAVQAGVDPVDAVEKGLAAGLREVGSRFERGDLFLAHMVIAASIFQQALQVLEPAIRDGRRELKRSGKIVLGTVQGDIHDIGKNIVGALLSAGGFEVFDLGKDVAPDAFVGKVKEVEAQIVGMSALLTTTIPAQKTVIDILRREELRCKTMVGGAAVSEEWAKEIQADARGIDAADAVKKARVLLGIGA